MSGPGRNDPCPCGSGKKYKQCCLTRAQATPEITREDRTEAMTALLRYLQRDEFGDALADAALIWADAPGNDPQAALDRINEQETSLQMFLEWLFFDLPGQNERTISERFLASRQWTIGPRAVDYIRLMQGTHLRAFQVRRVERDVGLDVRDLWTKGDLFISERTATHELAVWDILVARVVPYPDGTHRIDGTMMALPPEAEAELKEELKFAHEVFLEDYPGSSEADFFKQEAPSYMHDLWMAYVAEREPPTLQTVEGDPITTSRLEFQVADPREALATLDREPDFEQEAEGRAVWLEPGEETRRRLLGELTVDDNGLVLVTFSRERAARGRARLEAVLGPLPLRREEHHEPGSGPPPAHWQAAGETPDLAESLDLQHLPELQDWLAQKDREWLDLDIPALDGMTPREAAKNRRMRPRLKSLLMQMENRQARLSGHARDTAWMWKELGLRRP
jgi:hypothetical protein